MSDGQTVQCCTPAKVGDKLVKCQCGLYRPKDKPCGKEESTNDRRLTAAELEVIRKRESKATPGPWETVRERVQSVIRREWNRLSTSERSYYNEVSAAVIAAARAEIIAEWVRETGIIGVLLMARTKIEDMRECGDLSHEILEIDKCLARIKGAKE